MIATFTKIYLGKVTNELFSNFVSFNAQQKTEKGVDLKYRVHIHMPYIYDIRQWEIVTWVPLRESVGALLPS